MKKLTTFGLVMMLVLSLIGCTNKYTVVTTDGKFFHAKGEIVKKEYEYVFETKNGSKVWLQKNYVRHIDEGWVTP